MKQISRPEIASAHTLTPLELNGIRFSNRRLVITPSDLRDETAHAPAKGADG